MFLVSIDLSLGSTLDLIVFSLEVSTELFVNHIVAKHIEKKKDGQNSCHGMWFPSFVSAEYLHFC